MVNGNGKKIYKSDSLFSDDVGEGDTLVISVKLK